MNSLGHPRSQDIDRSEISTLLDASKIPSFPVRARDSGADLRAMAGRIDFELRAMPEAIGGRA